MFSGRASRRTDDDHAVRAAIEARRVANAIPDHLLPPCKPFPTVTDTYDTWSLPRRLLVAMYNGQMWLFKSSLSTARTMITNIVWPADNEMKQQVCHQSVQIHSCLVELPLEPEVIGLNNG